MQAAFVPHTLVVGFGGSTAPGGKGKGLSRIVSVKPGRSRMCNRPCDMTVVYLVQIETRIVCGPADNALSDLVTGKGTIPGLAVWREVWDPLPRDISQGCALGPQKWYGEDRLRQGHF